MQAGGRRLLAGTSYGGGTIPKENVVRALDFLLLHGNGVSNPDRIAEMVRQTCAVPGYTPKPTLFKEDDHFEFDQPKNNFIAAVGERASWGYFDFRMKGEGFDESYPPTDGEEAPHGHVIPKSHAPLPPCFGPFHPLADTENSPELNLHLIIDNYGIHKAPKMKSWLQSQNARRQKQCRDDRTVLHFTPTSSSWMNLVGRFIWDSSEDALRGPQALLASRATKLPP